MLKILLRIVVSLLLVIAVLTLGVAIFMNTAPQFGDIPSGERLEEIRLSPNYGEDQFENLIETRMDMDFWEGLKLIPEMMSGEEREPSGPLPTDFSENQPSIDSLVHVTWYGHSAVLLEIQGKRILLDPMLGPSSAPVSFFTPRFPYEQPINLDEIGDIDAVLFSHDHYDHLDYFTVTQIQERVGHFYTALGVGSHLRHWGVPMDKITELDWWDEVEFRGLTFVCTPARHFSGRGINDRNKTQWASWAVLGDSSRVYFSGDSGYGPHFKDIGDKYGPFDFAMMECGQYNEKWAAIHMMPEQTIQATEDLRSSRVMPIHWGGFNLALHTWTDPITRSTAEAKRKGVTIVHPIIGRRFEIGEEQSTRWWENLTTSQ